MPNNNLFQDLSARLSTLLPMADNLREDVRTKIEQQLKKSFESMDIINREEFDAQASSLKRAERKIEELENTLAELDEKIDALTKGPS